MAATYSAIRAALNDIPERTEANRRRLVQARSQLQAAIDDIQRMELDYVTVIQDLNSQAAASPGDAVLQRAKAEKDRLAADFQELKTLITAHIAAYDAV